MHIGSVVIDCNDFDTMMAFWAEALHYVPREPAEGDRVVLRDPAGVHVNVSLQKVPEGASEKNRLHHAGRSRGQPHLRHRRRRGLITPA